MSVDIVKPYESFNCIKIVSHRHIHSTYCGFVIGEVHVFPLQVAGILYFVLGQ